MSQVCNGYLWLCNKWVWFCWFQITNIYYLTAVMSQDSNSGCGWLTASASGELQLLPTLSWSSYTQQGTWASHCMGHSSHGFPTGQRIQERRKEKNARTKGLILQMASHRYAKSTGGKSWRSSEFQIFINSQSGPTSDKPTRHERQDYFA